MQSWQVVQSASATKGGRYAPRVPNGHEAFPHLRLVCATYRFRHGEWPTKVELQPRALRSLAETLDPVQLERLAERLQIVTVRPDDPIREPLIMVYGDADPVGSGDVEPSGMGAEEAKRWAHFADAILAWVDLTDG